MRPRMSLRSAKRRRVASPQSIGGEKEKVGEGLDCNCRFATFRCQSLSVPFFNLYLPVFVMMCAIYALDRFAR
jgi:hypothetical protein